jgi:hypothetical protein
MGLTRFPNGISSFGIPIYGNGSQDNSGTTFFVDNNYGSDGNDGFSWDAPLKTFARATALNNIDIARGSDRFARRNTIYYAADTEVATIVAFPNKCDVIGVGSYDANSQPGITGNHAPVNAANYGTRFINIRFKAPAVASPIVSLTSTSSGIQFIKCTFDGSAGTVTTAITNSLSPFMKIIGCKFIGAFATSDISLATGALVDVEIIDNVMFGSAGTGIVIHGSTTVASGGLIKDNFISSTGVCINDGSSKFNIVNNRVITGGVKGTAGAGGIVGGAYMMLDNRYSASDLANAIVPAQGTLA